MKKALLLISFPFLTLLLCASCDSGKCAITSDCFKAAECRSYSCKDQHCVYSFKNGDPVTCGNHDCADDGDCTSSKLIKTRCVNKVCIGTAIP